MPSAGLGGLGARGGVRVWTSGGALHASTGSTFISLPESSSSSSSLSSGKRRCRKRATTKPVWKSKFYVAFVLNHRVVLHAIDAAPARWRGDAGSSPLDRARMAASSPRNDLVKNCRVHPTHWLISTQVEAQPPVLVDAARGNNTVLVVDLDAPARDLRAAALAGRGTVLREEPRRVAVRFERSGVFEELRELPASLGQW